MKFGVGVTAYTIIAIILHCLFIAFCFIQRKIDCVGNLTDPISKDFAIELFLIWAIIYFPFLLLCAFYTLLFRMCRSFLCSCWECCGNNVNGKHATKCKICFEGVFGNPLIFAIIFIIWGIFEWISFGTDCNFEIQYGFLGDLIVVSLSLLLLCIYYFVRVKRRFQKKRRKNIAEKYNARQNEDAQIAAYDDDHGKGKGHGHGHGGMGGAPLGGRAGIAPAAKHKNQNNHIEIQVQAPPKRNRRQQFQQEGSGQPMPHRPDRRYSSANAPRGGRNGLAPGAPAYAASAHGIAPYQPEPRRHSYNPEPHQRRGNQKPPQYALSAQGVAPYRPDNQRRHSYQQQNSNSNNVNPLIDNNKPAAAPQNEESASIEISVDYEDDGDDDLIPGHRTRGPSISFPKEFKGHARRVSSGILNILKKIDAEPECSICMDDLAKGDEMGQLECGHTFHKDCIVEWLGNEASCPMCRVDMKK